MCLLSYCWLHPRADIPGCCNFDMRKMVGYRCIESLHYYFVLIISSNIIEVIRDPLDNTVEYVQIFKHLNKIRSKSPLYEATVSDLWSHFYTLWSRTIHPQPPPLTTGGTKMNRFKVISAASSVSARRHQRNSVLTNSYSLVNIAFCLSCFTLRNIKK